MTMQSLSRRSLLAGAAATLSSLAQITTADPLGPAWPPKRFPISMWCSPPERYVTPEQYARIAAAGFSALLPPCGGATSVETNRRILETARRAGLQVVLADPRMPLSISGAPKAAANLRALVSDYRKHPALLGYFITDEPQAGAFEGLAEVSAEIRRLDPDHLAYINLLPNYATNDLNGRPSQLGTQSYQDYLSRFVSTVHPQLISWDFYGLMQSGDRPGMFGNLAAAALAAQSANPPVPFWPIVLSVKHGPYRALSEAELLYEAMQAVAYGAQGLTWFTYWLPDDPSFTWSDGIMNRDGTPGPLYEPVKRVNEQVRALATYLYGAVQVSTFQTGDVPPDGRAQPDDVPVRVLGPGNLTIGVMRAETHLYVLAANRDYTKPVATTIRLTVGDRKPERLDLALRKWAPVKGDKDNDDHLTVDVAIGPASVALLRWE